MPNIESMGGQAIALFFCAIILIVCLMGGLLLFSWWISRTRGSLSPYSKKPMMLGVDLPFSIARYIEEYVKTLSPENKPFDCSKAAICRETGRIFPNAVKKGEIIRLGWDFLNECCPGNWVSWGSVPEAQRAMIALCHLSLDGYQTEVSSKERLPKNIDMYHALARPGPLYVDVLSKMLLGWKQVPGTTFEILVIQKPEYESIDERL